MFTDIINKQTFEISCGSEAVAKQVQHDIEGYAVPGFNKVMADVFLTYHSAGSIKIDRLEIDLGIITARQINSASLIEYFKKLLEKEMRSTQAPVVNVLCNMGKQQHEELHTANEIELLESIITRGDVPWWADKSNAINVDAAIKNVLAIQPAALQELLLRYKKTPLLLKRLYENIKPSTAFKIQQLMPAETFITDELLGKIFLKSGKKTYAEKILRDIKSVRKKAALSIGSSQQIFLAEKLYTYLIDGNVGTKQSVIDKLLERSPVFYHFLKTKTLEKVSRLSAKKKILKALHQLTVFETTVLLFELNNYSKKNSIAPQEAKPSAAKTSSVEASQISLVPSITGEEKRSGEAANAKEIIPNEQDSVAHPTLPTNADKVDTIQHSLEGNHGDANTNPAKEVTNLNLVEKIESAQVNQLKPRKLRNKEQQINGIKNLTEQLDWLPETRDATDKSNGPFATQQREQLIALLQKKLQAADPGIVNYIRQLSAEGLHELALLVSKTAASRTSEKSNIALFLKLPVLLQQKVLQLFAAIPFKEPARLKKMQPTPFIPGATTFTAATGDVQYNPSPYFLSVVQQLKPVEIEAVTTFLNARKNDIAQQQKVAKPLVQKLAQQDLMVLHYIAGLPPATLIKLQQTFGSKGLPQDNPETNIHEQNGQNIYIENAGLCLIAVYLPAIFKALGYTKEGKFKNSRSVIRAVFLLQYIATGSTARPEYLLQFNKLLCGVNPADVAIDTIRLSKKEKQEADDLIKAVIKNWGRLKNTSAEGFRGSFLLRKGILTKTEQGWLLRVEKKGFDVLLDGIPWGFSLIKLSWMQTIIAVEW